jgi:uncharacterized RDD family membrane protein YckC
MNNTEIEYVGFWLRLWASIIDTVLILVIIAPILSWIYGVDYWLSTSLIQGPADFLISWVLPAIAVLIFWIYRQATPGKMAIGARIVDATTGDKPSTGQLIGRYFAYYVSALPLLIGFIWVGIDKRKQGFHDMLAQTVVVRTKGPTAVKSDASAAKR